MVIKIRKATLDDLTIIDKIYTEGSVDEGKLQFPKISRKEMLNDLKKAEKERLKNWVKEIKSKKNYWIIAEEKKQILGFGHSWLKNQDLGNVEKVYVSKINRKRGVGKKIILELINWLKKKKTKYIESSIYFKNTPSIKLHQKLKFNPISIKMRLK